LVYRYTVRPAEFVSQIPNRPLAVFKANVVPEAVELGAAEAVLVVAGLVVVAPPAGLARHITVAGIRVVEVDR
jgi:hypothetical protein